MPSDLALNCRNLCREYYDLMDNRSAYVNKLQGELRMAFPQYLGIFSKITANTSLTLLKLIHLHLPLLKQTRKRLLIPLNQLHVLELHIFANTMPLFKPLMMLMNLAIFLDSNIKRIRLYISFIRKYDEEIKKHSRCYA